MADDRRFYRHLAERLKVGPVAIATVIQTTGSVPREVGAQLMLWGRGNTFGTIGGGAGEAKVLRQAEQVLATGHKQQVTIDLSGAPHREIQGICGGQMQVWVERWQGEAAIALSQDILSALSTGQSVTLAIPLSLSLSPYIVSHPKANAPNRKVDSKVPEETEGPIISLVLHPPPTLLIVGGGHCGIQLANAADFIGFQIIVQDERPQWANTQNFPQALRIFNQPIAELADALACYGPLYAALVTRGMDYDLPALKLLLTDLIPCRYIGMMGSQKRIQTALDAIAHPIALEKRQILHVPIGLDIGALTPEEIAISICAELIQVRRRWQAKR